MMVISNPFLIHERGHMKVTASIATFTIVFTFVAATIKVDARSAQETSKQSSAELLKAARTALGGEARLSGIKTLILKGEQRSLNQMAGFGAQDDKYIVTPIEMRALLPDNYVRSRTFLGHIVQNGFRGRALINEHDGPGMLGVLQDEFAQLMLLLLLRMDTGTPLTLRASNSSTTLEFSGDGGFPIFVDLDKTSHLPCRLRKQEQIHIAGALGPIVNLIMSVDDWRDVKGLRLPHHLSYMEGGTLTYDIRFQSIEINPPLAPADFKEPRRTICGSHPIEPCSTSACARPLGM